LEETVHQHGPAGEHSHTGTAFTAWLDPSLAIRQAQTIEQALSALTPEHSHNFKTNLAGLRERLQSLDRDLQQAFQALDGEALIFSHPVYQYLQARYGLNGLSLHWEPEELPGTRAWIDLHEILGRHPATLMIWEDDPLVETREQLQRSGIHSVSFQTASNRPAAGDYFDVMKANLERLESVAMEP
jgi:zinc transport system substrate-binding protein